MSRLIRRMFDRASQKMPRRGRVTRPVRTAADVKARLLLQPLEERMVPTPYMVLNTNDSGPGSLRQAITDANANPGADDIQFNMAPGAGLNDFSKPQQITLLATLPTISGSLVITGPGADLLTVRQTVTTTSAGGVFSITSAASDVTISDMTITGGRTSVGGGAINVAAATNLTVRNVTLAGNSATSDGGAIRMAAGGNLQVENTALFNNTSAATGGAIAFSGVVTTFFNVFNSTISGNTATSGSAISMVGTFASPYPVQIRNTTISGNSASSTGTTNGTGGAITRTSGTSAITVLINSSIVAGNSATVANGRPDISADAAMTVATDHSLIGNTNGFTYVPGTGDLAPGTAVGLGPLGYYGGRTQVYYPLGGANPLINAGDNSFGFTTDQRGANSDSVNFPRADTTSNLPDIGAAERIGSIITAGPGPTFPTLVNATTAASLTPFQFEVKYTAEPGATVTAASLGGNDVVVIGPDGTPALGAISTVSPPTVDANTLTVRYQFSPAGGTWTGAANGIYFIRSADGTVTGSSGGATKADPIGSFTVLMPKTYTVTTTADSGAGSLRQAILDSNALTGTPDTIDMSGITGVINLATALPTIADSLTITGPSLDPSGAPRLIVRHDPTVSATFRILTIGGTGVLAVNLNNLWLTGANAGSSTGAGVQNTDETLTLTNTWITGNSTTGAGGGLYSSGAAAVTLINSNISGNSAGGNGGGIDFFNSGSLTLINSSVTGNTALGSNGGGGIYFFGTVGVAGFAINNSTIANNVAGNAAGGGGGIVFSSLNTTTNTQPVNVRNSTITGNSTASSATAAGTGGGGIAVLSATAGATINLVSTVLSGNQQVNSTSNRPDISVPASGVTVNANFSAIGDTTGVTLSGTSGSNVAPGTNLLLSPLQFLGGPTRSFYPLAGSPLLEAGSNPTSATTDQRGATRTVGTIDIGSVERNGNAVGASAAPFADVTVNNLAALANNYTFQVTYRSESPISVGTIDVNDVTVTGPAGAVPVTAVASVDASNPNAVVVSYRFAAPGGSWDAADNGVYTVRTVAGQVTDGSAGSPAALLGAVQVAVGQTIHVTNLNDAGAGSLRQAITDANTSFGIPDAIVFDMPNGVINLLSALPTVSDSVTITGPALDPSGAPQLVINRNAFSNRNLAVSGAGVINVGLSNLVFIGGGGISNADEVLTLTNTWITGNSTTSAGGGLYTAANGVLNLVNTLVSGNSSGGVGGGIATGALTTTGASLNMVNSSVSGNRAAGGNGGGGIYWAGTIPVGGQFTVSNSTVASNIASGTSSGGGGIAFRSLNSNGGPVAIRNSTITGNSTASTSATAGLGGGGLALETVATATGAKATVNVVSTVISGNLQTAGANARPDVSSVGGSSAVNFTFSAVGSSTGMAAADVTSYNAAGNNIAFGTALLLGPTQFNGGPTLSVYPLGGSPLVNAGSNPAGLATDQRGLTRVVGGTTDIGAVERSGNSVGAAAAPNPSGAIPALLTNINLANASTANPYTFTVTYTSESGATVDTSTIGAADVSVVTPPGVPAVTIQPVLPADINATNPAAVVVTYKFTPPGGTWDGPDNGLYAVRLNSGQVLDSTGAPAAAQVLGTFTVAVPNTYVVLNTNDSGAGSLRQAILDANGNLGLADVILFNTNPALGTDFDDATPDTITLTSGELLVADSVTITGPGMNLLTVSGGGTSRIFDVNGAGVLTVAISGMRVTGGNGSTGTTAGKGGGITIDNETVTLTDMLVEGNSATEGGGIQVTAAGTLTVLNSIVRNNTATSDDGGGIYLTSSSAVTVRNTTISGNVAADDGAGLYFFSSGALLLENSTVSGNSAGASGEGGGMYLFSSPNTTGPVIGWTIRNSTISGNVAGTNGGGIVLKSLGGTGLVVQNSTITANSAGGGGGGIGQPSSTGLITLTSTIDSGNTSTTGPDIFTTGTLTADHSAIGSSTGIPTASVTTYNAPANANLAFGAALLLGPLANNGGPTQTHLPDITSPVVDRGSNPASLTTDQRGTGFPRVSSDGLVDIGAVEVGNAVIPTAVANGPTGTGPLVSPITPANAAANTPYVFTVTYHAGTGTINTGTINANNVVVTSPANVGPVTVQTVNPGDINATDPANVVVTYRLTPPGGSWNGADNGTFTIDTTSVSGNQVQNSGGVHVAPATLGTFQVNFPVPAAAGAGPGGTGSFVSPVTNVNAAANTPYVFTVTYTTTLGTIDTTSIGANDILITGPAAGTVQAVPPADINATNPAAVVVTYRFTPPGGSWDPSDSGTYTIATTNVFADQVLNSDGGHTPATTLGTFLVAIGNTFTVLNTADSGAGSLRQAILDSNGAASPDTIVFNTDPALGTDFDDATPDTITLGGTELLISDSTTIVGPGMNLLTVSGGGTSRIFDISGAGTLLVNISGMRITGGNGSTGTTSAAGGGILIGDENVTLSSVLVEGNSATDGGGIRVSAAAGVLTVQDSIIRNNTATSDDGGGIYLNSSSQLTVRNTTISGNRAVDDGAGIYFFSGGALLLENSTITGNSAGAGGEGGGMYFFGTVNTTGPLTGLTVRNSTISGNSAGSNGGGIVLKSLSGTLVVQNSTITNNTSGGGGGGIGQPSSTGPISLTSTIVSGNFSATGPDVFTTGVMTADHSAVGSSTGIPTASVTTYNDAANANLAFGAVLNLQPLADNGGPTQTHALGGGSAAIDKGANPATLATDQRGSGHARTINLPSVPDGTGGATDIGAYELDATIPTAAASGLTSPINAGNAAANNPYVFQVTYAANTGTINTATISANNIVVTSPAGVGPVTVQAVAPADINATDPANVIVTYRLTPPGGSWNSADNGTFTIATTSVAGDQVQNSGGGHVAAGSIGSFAVAFPPPTATGGTLTTPINQANAGANNPYVFTVTYAPSIGTINTATINANNIVVTGPGAVTVQPVAPADINTSNPNAVVVTYRLTPPGGSWDITDNGTYTISTTGVPGNQVQNSDGGHVPTTTVGSFLVAVGTSFTVLNTNDSGAGSLRQAILDANAVNSPDTIVFNTDPALGTDFDDATPDTITLAGTEIAISDSLTITGPGAGLLTVSGNNASRIFNVSGTGQLNVFISGVTLTAGSASGRAGALLSADENITLTAVRLTNNTSTSDGGALAAATSGGSLTILDSLITGNSAVGTSSDGGAFYSLGAAVTIRNSTISGNSSNDGGGVSYMNGGSLLLENSTLSGNIANGTSTSNAGALYLLGTPTAAGWVISNSTIANNSCQQQGGAIFMTTSTPLTVRNSTIANNTAGGTQATAAGGIRTSSATSTIALISSIVANNVGGASGPADISAAGAVTADHSAVGSGTGFDNTNYNTPANANLAFGATLNLGPLANNGGPTQTMALGAGSAAINAGSNPAGLTTDQRGPGFPRVNGAAADIGAFEAAAPATPPTVANVQVNGAGVVQRSEVRSIVVTFSEVVNFVGGNGNAAAAFTLSRVGSGGNAGLVASVQTVGTQTVVTLTFTNTNPAVIDNTVLVNPATPSLADGIYRLAIADGQVTGAGSGLALDGDANGSAGGAYITPQDTAGSGAGHVFGLYRLFGDATGNAVVDLADLQFFRQTFNQVGPPPPNPNYLAFLDADNNNVVDLNDLQAFRTRFNVSLF